MQPMSGIKTAPLSRKAWMALLARGIRTPQVEPPVRRRSRRYAAALGTAWRILCRKGHKNVELRATLMNASAEGVMLVCRTEVPAYVPVFIAFTSVAEEECALAGEVRHCTSTIGGYKVGVRLRFPDSHAPVK
jgi:hypothetical protein